MKDLAIMKGIENMNKDNIKYGITPIYRICSNGDIEQFVVSGYAEKEEWVSEEGCYRIVEYVYGRNDRCSSACFTMNPIGKNHFCSLIGENAFFSMEELQDELKRREQEKVNLKQAHIAEINSIYSKPKRRKKPF